MKYGSVLKMGTFISSDKLVYVGRMFCFLLILFLGVYDITEFYGPTTGVDDIGYWSTAYYFAFGESKEVASGLSYYAYGYGLLLAPLVKFIFDGTILFRTIIVLNTFLNAVSFVILTIIFDKLLKDISRGWITFFSFVAILYVSNYSYSKFIFTESFLVFLYLCLCLTILEMLRKYSVYKFFGSMAICVMMHFVHQRTLAMMVAYGLLIIILLCKKIIPIKDVLFACVVAAVIFFSGMYLKNNIMDYLYRDNVNLATNDYSSNVSKLAGLFQKDGIFYFLLSLWGKLFYFSFGTMLLGGVGLLSCLVKVKKFFFNREIKKDNFNYIYLFFALTWLLVIGIATVFMYGPLGTRFEIAVYGRYVEYIFTVFIVIGLVELLRKEKIVRVYLVISIVVLLVGCACVNYQFIIDNQSYSTSWLSPATFSFFYYYKDLGSAMILMAKLSLSLFIILYFFTCLKMEVLLKKISIVILAMICVAFWGKNGYQLEQRYLQSQRNLRNECEIICDNINEKNLDVAYRENDETILRIREMQFLCSEIDFYNQSPDEIFDGDNKIVLTNKLNDSDLAVTNQYKILIENDTWILWERIDN